MGFIGDKTDSGLVTAWRKWHSISQPRNTKPHAHRFTFLKAKEGLGPPGATFTNKVEL